MTGALAGSLAASGDILVLAGEPRRHPDHRRYGRLPNTVQMANKPVCGDELKHRTLNIDHRATSAAHTLDLTPDVSLSGEHI